MSISKVFLLNAFLIMFSTACSNDMFITHNGNMPSNERIGKSKPVKAKRQSKAFSRAV